MARKLALPDALAQLGEAAELASGRSDPAAVERASQVAQQASRRLALADGSTVVALAGATGSGKSSLFNAVTRTQLAEPGVRRPTTSLAMSASFGDEPTALLDWLDVQRRRLVVGADAKLSGLVLLDLPDHDSTEASHRAEVDRLVRVVDQFVFVVDPQKYADAALHERYLRPLAGHRDVMVIVLNQIDQLTPEHARACLADLRRILDADGLKGVPIIATSALTGQGIDELRKRLGKVVHDKDAATTRLRADLADAARSLRATVADGEPALAGSTVAQLTSTLGAAAGVDLVVEATLGAMRHRGTLATGWPFVKWLARLRPDPLKRLRVGRRAERPELEPVRIQRTSLPKATTAAEARVASAVRALAKDAGSGLPEGWQAAVLAAARSNQALLPDDLDKAMAVTDLGTDRGTWWWTIVRVLQWILMLAVVVGLGWLAVNAVLAYFMLVGLPVPQVGVEGGFHAPLPTVLALGGAAGGLLLALVSRLFVELGARAAARRARSALTRAIHRVARDTIIDPVRAELDRHARVRDLVNPLS